MDKEIEAQINQAIDKVNSYLLWEIRKIAGEFPYRLRVDCFFAGDETKSTHFMEREVAFSSTHLEAMEIVYQKELTEQIIQDANEIIRAKKSE